MHIHEQLLQVNYGLSV